MKHELLAVKEVKQRRRGEATAERVQIGIGLNVMHASNLESSTHVALLLRVRQSNAGLCSFRLVVAALHHLRGPTITTGGIRRNALQARQACTVSLSREFSHPEAFFQQNRPLTSSDCCSAIHQQPFSDVRNYLRVSLHKERGIDSEKVKALNEQRRRSGGVGPSCFDEVAAGQAEVFHAPIASTSRSTLPSLTDEAPSLIPQPSSAGGHSDPYSSLGLSGKRPEWDSLLPSPSSPGTSLPSSPDEPASLGPSPSLQTPPRPSSAELPASLAGQPRWKGKARAQHPVLVETCPTPPSSAKYRPGSRQRSIMNPSGLGIDVAEFEYDAYGAEEEEVEELEEEDPNDWDPYSRRPSSEFTLPLQSSASASALPFPSDLVVESLLSSQPSTSSFAFPHSSPHRYRGPHNRPRDRDFTPPLAHLRPVRKSEILASPALSNRRPTTQELRAKASNSTLFSWDLAHLPAPNTPREKPFKVGLRSLLMPS